MVLQSKKKNICGQIETYKAWFMVNGYSQPHGIDYEETFAPVVRHSSICLLLSLAVQYDIDQMEVVSAFLQSELDGDINMNIPEGLQKESNLVFKLKKSLYRLKQANRVWNKILDVTLKQYGLNQSKTEPCIYFLVNENIIIYVAIYVDDIL